jgi:RimJ/RimL family protein N-acetyltransferase
MAEIVLETPRLALRRFRDNDLSAWLEHMNTPQVRAHLGGKDSPEKAAERFERQKASWTDEGGGWLIVERREDGALLGNCGFSASISEKAPEEMLGGHEIGWALRRDSWGQGYASEAASGLLDLIFDRFGLGQVYSQTSEANRGSWRVMERLGFERLAHLDYDDPDFPPEENPTKVYRLTRSQWEARHG